MCKHAVYTTIVNFQMSIVYRRKIKNGKKEKQNSVKNVIFNGIAQNTVKVCLWELLKVSTLKHFMKETMNSSFCKAPCTK